MKTLLVLAPQPAMASAIRAVLDPARYRLIQQNDQREDMIPASIDACIVDVDLTTIAPIRIIERLRNRLPNCPVILYSAASQWEWEEEAYLHGASHILNKPVRGRLLNALLDRLLTPIKTVSISHSTEIRSRAETKVPAESSQLTVRMLELLHNCSSILSHSLCADSLLKEFLLLLREIIGVNRAAIFLRQPPGSISAPTAEGAQRLHAACANGLAPGLLEHFELSLEAGIGAHVFRSGRIVRRSSAEAERDPQILKEFELLSAEVAIPIMDRQSFLGLAVFDGRVTGEPMSNEELTLTFHLLEQLGMTIKNIWLHDQLAANHDMLGSILRQLKSACVVVACDLSLVHANETARRWFSQMGRSGDVFEFTNLPQPIGSKVFEVLKTGKSVTGFKFQTASAPDSVYQITITPFQKESSAPPNAALLIIDDFSHVDRIQKLEIEAANLRLVKKMAQRLAHEIGNAMVPISTHQQLIKERLDESEPADSLTAAMETGIQRVTRLIAQMRFLARDQVEFSGPIPLKELMEEAFQEARTHYPDHLAVLQFETSNNTLTLVGDRAALQHAFSEIILNALQTSASAPSLLVRTHAETHADGSRWARIEVQDGGSGFTAETTANAAQPFFTTRTVGLGLGLAVSTTIIQIHQGKLEIPATQSGKCGLVRVSLPLFASEGSNGCSNGKHSN